MSNANKRQIGGDHYRKHVLEHWDIVALYQLDYFQGCSTKYIMRWREKGGIQDLEKSRHFIDKYIEIEKLRAAGELTEIILLDALKKLAEMEAEEPMEYNVSGDDPLVLEGNPRAQKPVPKCKECVYDQKYSNVCSRCGRPRMGDTGTQP